jgi:hypothetical protein
MASRSLARAAAAAAAVALAALPAAAGASDDPARLAEAVERDVVHVDPRVRERLTAAEASRLRVRIARRDAGRIRVLVVPRVAAARNGGLRRLADDVAVRTGLGGALIAVAGPNAWIATTYDSGPALSAVQRAMQGRSGERLAPGLLRAVDGIAGVDPGPAGDVVAAPAPAPAGDGGVGEVVEDVGNAIRVVVWGIGGAIALAILTPLAVFAVRARRRRAESAEDLEVARQAAREELVAVGEILRELDLDAEMPSADAGGRDALGRAIDLYDRAGRELQRADTHRRLRRAHRTVARAREEAHLARRRLTQAPAL